MSLFPSLRKQDQSNSTETKRGIDTRLVAELARLEAVKAAYYAGKATSDEYQTAADKVRELRCTPMKSALDEYYGGF
jgi:hypothetical protein